MPGGRGSVPSPRVRGEGQGEGKENNNLCAGPHRTGVIFGVKRENCKERMPSMNITLGLTPLVSLIAGILILIVPRLLNYIVALYLIVIGLIGLFGAGNFHF